MIHARTRAQHTLPVGAAQVRRHCQAVSKALEQLRTEFEQLGATHEKRLGEYKASVVLLEGLFASASKSTK